MANQLLQDEAQLKTIDDASANGHTNQNAVTNGAATNGASRNRQAAPNQMLAAETTKLGSKTSPSGEPESATQTEIALGNAVPVANTKKAVSPRRKLLIGAAVLAVLAGAGVYAKNSFAWNSVHVSTDDAYLTSDLVQITPQVGGSLNRVLVSDNQVVKKGQLLAVLDDATYRAQVAQQQANLAVAQANERAAQVGIGLTGATGESQILQAQGGVEQANSGIGAAQSDALRNRGGISAAQAAAQNARDAVVTARAAVVQAIATRDRVSQNAEALRTIIASATAGYAQAQGALRAATAGIAAAQASRNRAAAGFSSANAVIATAEAGVRAARDAVIAARAQADRANKDEMRYEQLFNGNAVSEQSVEVARATATTARAQLQSAQEQLTQAQTLVEQRRQDAQGAMESVRAGDANVAQARAQASQARSGIEAASAAVRSARAQYAAAQSAIGEAQAGIAQNQTKIAGAQDTVLQAQATLSQAQAQYQTALQNIGVAQGKKSQALGQLKQAQTSPQQLTQSQSNAQTAHARVLQALAALRDAQINLDRTKITAPLDGIVSRRNGQLGQQVAVGQPIMAVIPRHSLWIVANLKETQMTGVHPGQRATVEVDAFSKHEFTGHVDSLSAGTGATFALLPPDNASGNFTKVVQRVPIKVVLDANQKDLDQLRSGLSAVVTISTRDK